MWAYSCALIKPPQIAPDHFTSDKTLSSFQQKQQDGLNFQKSLSQKGLAQNRDTLMFLRDLSLSYSK